MSTSGKNIVQLTVNAAQTNDTIFTASIAKVPAPITTQYLTPTDSIGKIIGNDTNAINTVTGFVQALLGLASTTTITGGATILSKNAVSSTTSNTNAINFNEAEDVDIDFLYNKEATLPTYALAKNVLNTLSNMVHSNRNIHLVDGVSEFTKPLTDTQQYSAARGSIYSTERIMSKPIELTSVQKLGDALVSAAIDRGILTIDFDGDNNSVSASVAKQVFQLIISNISDESLYSILFTNTGSITEPLLNVSSLLSRLPDSATTLYNEILDEVRDSITSDITRAAITQSITTASTTDNNKTVVNAGDDKISYNDIDVIAAVIQSPTLYDISQAAKDDTDISIDTMSLFWNIQSGNSTAQMFINAATDIRGSFPPIE